MKFIVAVLALVLLSGSSASAYTSTRSYTPTYRSYNYSQPRTYSQPKTSTPKTSTPTKTTTKGSWSGNKSYGTGKGTKVGKGKLVSNTPKPEPHSLNGRKFYSSDAIYTNTSGQWVTYFILGALVANAVDTSKDEVHCFDKDHKEITCNRDDNSYSKDW